MAAASGAATRPAPEAAGGCYTEDVQPHCVHIQQPQRQRRPPPQQHAVTFGATWRRTARWTPAALLLLAVVLGVLACVPQVTDASTTLSIGGRMLLVYPTSSDTVADVARVALQGHGVPTDEFLLYPSVVGVRAGALSLYDSGSKPRYCGIIRAGVGAVPLTAPEEAALASYLSTNGILQAIIGTPPSSLAAYLDASAVTTVTAGGGSIQLDPSVGAKWAAGWVSGASFPVPAGMAELRGAVVSATAPAGSVQVFARFSEDSSVAAVLITDPVTHVTTLYWFLQPISSASITAAMLGSVTLQWLSRGVFIGKRQSTLLPQVENLFLSEYLWNATSGQRGSRTYRATPEDLDLHDAALTALNTRLPTGSSVSIELAFSGYGTVDHGGTSGDPLLFRATALRSKFYWVSNTYSYMSFTKVNTRTPACAMPCGANCYNIPTPAAGVTCEIVMNQQFSSALLASDCAQSAASRDAICQRFSVSTLVTPASSGLFNSPAMMATASAGIKAVMGDNSCTQTSAVCDGSLTPSSYFAPTVTPATSAAGLVVIPRWPTNVFYDVQTPAQWVSEFRSRQTAAPYNTYTLNDLLALEADVTVAQILSQRHDPFVFHQANLGAYQDSSGADSSLLTAWLDAVVSRYIQFSTLPLLSVASDALADMYRTSAATAACGLKTTQLSDSATHAVFAIDLESTAACTITVSGFKAIPNSRVAVSTYGPDVVSAVSMTGAAGAFRIYADIPTRPADAVVTLPSNFNAAARGAILVFNIQLTQHHPGGITRNMTGVAVRLTASSSTAFLEGTVLELGNGRYRATLTPYLAGSYALNITADGALLGSSPYSLSVAAGSIAACGGQGQVIGTAVSCVTTLTDTAAPTYTPACAGGALRSCCQCTCNSGYWGVGCTHQCPGGASNACQRRGVCDMLTGQCACSNGFWGSDCSKSCPGGSDSPCSNRGTCNSVTGVCTCDAGYWGPACASACPGSNSTMQCSGHGSCSAASGTCTCDQDYFGADCSKYCHTTHTCNDHGRCDSAGNCVCNVDYTGISCTIGTCGTNNRCSGHGTCWAGRCSCVKGYFGDVCNSICPGWNGTVACSGHGGCGSTLVGSCCASGLCICQAGFWGADCAQSCTAAAAATCSGAKCPRRIVANRVLIVAPDTLTADDADSIKLVTQVLTALQIPYTQVALADLATLAFTDAAGVSSLSSQPTGRFGATVLVRQPATVSILAPLDAYEAMFQLRRVVMSISPGASGFLNVPATAAAANRLYVLTSGALKDFAEGFPLQSGITVNSVDVLGAAVITTVSSCVSSSAAIGVANDASAAAVAAIHRFPTGRQELHMYLKHGPNKSHSVALAPAWVRWMLRGIYVGRPYSIHGSIVLMDVCKGSGSTGWAAVSRQKLLNSLLAVDAKAAKLPLGSQARITLVGTTADQAALPVASLLFSVQVDWVADLKAPASGCPIAAVVGPTCSTASTSVPACAGSSATALTVSQLTAATGLDSAQRWLTGTHDAILIDTSALLDATDSAPFQRWVESLMDVLTASTTDPVTLGVPAGLELWKAPPCTTTSFTVLEGAAALGMLVQSQDAAACSTSVMGLSSSLSAMYNESIQTVTAWSTASRLLLADVPVRPSDCTHNVASIAFMVGVPAVIVIQVHHPLGVVWDRSNMYFAVSVECEGGDTSVESLLPEAIVKSPARVCYQGIASPAGNGAYVITYTPQSAGKLHVRITLDGQDIASSPATSAAVYSWWSRAALVSFGLALLVLLISAPFFIADYRRKREAERKEAARKAAAAIASTASLLVERPVTKAPALNTVPSYVFHGDAIPEGLTPVAAKLQKSGCGVVVNPVLTHPSFLTGAAPNTIILAAVNVTQYFDSEGLSRLSEELAVLFDEAGYHGVVFQGLDEVPTPVARSLILESGATRRRVVLDGGYDLVLDDFDLLKDVDAVVMRNGTMQRDGALRPLRGGHVSERSRMLKHLKKHTLNRSDFILIAVEELESVLVVQAAAIVMFLAGSWTEGVPFRPCLDFGPSSSLPASLCTSPLAVFDLPAVKTFLDQISVRNGPETDRCVMIEAVMCNSELIAPACKDGATTLSRPVQKILNLCAEADAVVVSAAVAARNATIVPRLGAASRASSAGKPASSVGPGEWTVGDVAEARRLSVMTGVSAATRGTRASRPSTVPTRASGVSGPSGSFISAADMDPSPALACQKQIGTTYTAKQWQSVVAVQNLLRTKGLLKCLSSEEEQEKFVGDTAKNEVVKAPSAVFLQVRAQLSAVVAAGFNGGVVLEGFEDSVEQILNCIQQLLQSMSGASGSVQLWQSDAAGLCPADSNLPPFLAVFEEEGETMHLYVSNRHPNVAEAVLHCWLLSRGFLLSQCMILERLVSRTSTSDLLSDRVLWQLGRCSVTELALLVQHTRRALEATDNLPLSVEQRQLVQDATLEISSVARDLMLTGSDPSKKVFSLPQPTTTLESQVYDLACQAAWNPDSLSHLDSLLRVINIATTQAGPGVGPTPSMLAVRTMILSALRQPCFLQLATMYRAQLPFPVREPDVITTFVEMMGYNDEQLDRIFGVRKHKFGRLLFQEIRDQMREDNPPASSFYDEATATAKSTSKQSMNIAKNAETYAHGMFYSVPAILDLALATVSGSGVFASDQFSPGAQDAVSLAMLFSFVVAGGINASIAATGSFYLHQWSMQMVPVIVLERITACALISGSIALLGGIAMGIKYADVTIGCVFAFYMIAFAALLCLLGGVLTLETGNNFRKAGGQAVLQMLVILIIAPILVLLRLPIPPIVVYCITLAFAVGFLAVRFNMISLSQNNLYKGLAPSKDDDVLTWYSPQFTAQQPPPSALAKSKQTKLAREAFMAAVELEVKAMAKPGGAQRSKAAPLVRGRAAVYAQERSLVDWFCMTQALCAPAPWSADWDSLLEQGLEAMWMQMHSMRRIRGSLLWIRESNQVAFGAAYFVMIFLDRIVRLIGGSGPTMFLPTSDGYSYGVAWATVFFIITSPVFELTLQAISQRSMDALEDLRIGVSGTKLSSVLNVKRGLDRSLYRSQLWLFLRTLLLGSGLASGVMWLVSRNATQDVWAVYFCALLGYCGMLFGLFNKMFMGNREEDVMTTLYISISCGFIVGLACSILLQWQGGSVLAIGVTGVLYGVLSMAALKLHKSYIEADDSPLSILTPAMQTSGQRWAALAPAGVRRCKTLEASVVKHISELDAEYRVQLFTEGLIGSDVVSLLKSAAERLESLKANYERHLFVHAFPGAVDLLFGIIDVWQQRQVELWLVPADALRAPNAGFAAISHRAAGSDTLVVYVGVPWAVHDQPQVIARQVAEGLLHECFEMLYGYTHSDAVLAELLLNDQPDAFTLPARIVAQLTWQDRPVLEDVVRRTDDVILRRTLLELPVDRQWEQYSRPLRELLVSLLEYLGMYDTPILLEDSIMSLLRPGLRMLRTQDSVLFKSPIDSCTFESAPDDEALSALVARVHLANCMSAMLRNCAKGLLEVAASPQTQSTRSPTSFASKTPSGAFGESEFDNLTGFLATETQPQLMRLADYKKQTFPRFWASLAFMRRFMVVFPRITFLALTGDVEFGRELSAGVQFVGGGGWFLRLFLPLYFRMARWLVVLLIDVMLWRSRAFLHSLQLSLEGQNRTFHRFDRKLSIVERHRPFQELTAFAHRVRQPGPEAATLTNLVLHIYKGSLAEKFANWREPVNRAGMGNKAEYNGVETRSRFPRLVRLLDLDAAGKAVKSRFYSYEMESSVFPRYRLTVAGDIPVPPSVGSDWHDSEQLATLGLERALYDSTGRVCEEVISCANKVTKEKVFLIAKYRHGTTDPESVVEAAYEQPGKWAMIARYWVRSDNGKQLPGTRVSMVVTRNQTAAYLTRFSYLHPRHPVVTTTLLSVVKFEALWRQFGNAQSDGVWSDIDSARAATVVTPKLVADDLFGLLQRDAYMSFADEDLLHTAFMSSRAPSLLLNFQLWMQVASFVAAAAVMLILDTTTGSGVNNFAHRPVWVYVGAAVLGLMACMFWPQRATITSRRYSTRPLPTHLARMLVWKLWRTRVKSGECFEAVHARLFDELLLRRVSVLDKYWAKRDSGHGDSARAYLSRNRDAVNAELLLSDAAAFRSHLHLRTSDLEASASGGDSAYIMTEDQLAQMQRSSGHKLVEALGLDSGTWPMDGGGVASCRRDLVDRISSVRWYMVAELGHELRSIKDAYQVERNLISVQYLPLWGMNFNHQSQTQLAEPFVTFEAMALRTTPANVRKYFIPLLSQFIEGCLNEMPSDQDMERYTHMVCNMYHYFQRFDWQATWKDPQVHHTWCRLWSEHVLSLPAGDLLTAECPNLANLEEGLSFYIHFLTPLSLPLTPSVPVVQATHHGIQSFMGVVAKHVYKASFTIWDHGILWRERLVALSTFRGASLFSRNCLACLQRLAAFMTLREADVLVPCTNIGNPGWEMWLAGGRGDSRRMAATLQRISPVVNGMETDRFYVTRSKEEPEPAAIMLSHVCDVKDVKNAILAAEVIVHKFKISNYRLIIYGSTQREATYTSDCQFMISSKGLTKNVTLEGLGDAAKVVSRGWVFLNSSKTEGLPLALGEAGLAGLPVVCTDVGGSREILMNGVFTYGAIAPPGKPEALARAQLTVFAMLGGLEEMVSDPEGWIARNGVPAIPVVTLDAYDGPDGPERLLARIREATPARQRLGMLYRATVLRDFSMQRYLREHEQILWVCNAISRFRRGQAVTDVHLAATFVSNRAASSRGIGSVGSAAGSVGGQSPRGATPRSARSFVMAGRTRTSSAGGERSSDQPRKSVNGPGVVAVATEDEGLLGSAANVSVASGSDSDNADGASVVSAASNVSRRSFRGTANAPRPSLQAERSSAGNSAPRATPLQATNSRLRIRQASSYRPTSATAGGPATPSGSAGAAAGSAAPAAAT